jgi:hypothetical protein
MFPVGSSKGFHLTQTNRRPALKPLVLKHPTDSHPSAPSCGRPDKSQSPDRAAAVTVSRIAGLEVS